MNIGGMLRSDWHRAEMARWHGGAPSVSWCNELRAASHEHTSIVLFEVVDGHVIVHDKRDAWPDTPGAETFYSHMRYRAEVYRTFIEESLDRFGCSANGIFLVDLTDLHDTEPAIPVFAFQKKRGSSRLLLPDLDSLVLGFYRGPEFYDRISSLDKTNRAVFVGSTTGDLPLTMDIVSRRANSRIDAALFFTDTPNVDFWLPAIVQCDSPATEAAVGALDVAGRRLDWSQQLAYRYLLSMDGNGATCSRVSIALQSNSVLVKYASCYELSYFKGLVEGLHYIGVNTHHQVVDIVRSEEWKTRAAAISRQARNFAAANMSRIHAMRYTAALLNAYLDQFGSSFSPPPARTVTAWIDLAARFVGGGYQWIDRGGTIGAEPGREIAAVDVFVDGAISRREVELTTVAGPQRPWTRTLEDDQGGDGGEALRYLTIRLRGRSRLLFTVKGSVRHADGANRPITGNWQAQASSSAIVGLTIALVPRWFYAVFLDLRHELSDLRERWRTFGMANPPRLDE